MDIINQYQNKIKKLQGELPLVARKIVKKHEEEIITTYQINQISQGLKVGTRTGRPSETGINIGYYKSEFTQVMWKEYWFPQEPPTDKYKGFVVDLYWTGDFYSAMYIYFSGKYEYVINSGDKKTPMLVQKYGDIFTLAGKTARIVEKQIIEPSFTKEFNKRFSAIV